MVRLLAHGKAAKIEGGSFDALGQTLKRMFLEAMIEVLKADFVNDYMESFEYHYDSEFIWGVNLRPEDPTSPQYIKPAVVNFVRTHLSQRVQTITFSGDFIELKALPDSLWTLPTRKERNKVKLFYFYLHGTPGKYVVLDRNAYKKMWPQIDKSSINIGRFGHVHMLPLHKYKEWYYDPGLPNQSEWPHPSTIYHPFSGAAPSVIFDRVFWTMDFGKYVEKTKKALSKS